MPLDVSLNELPMFGPDPSPVRKVSVAVITVLCLLVVSGAILWGLGAHKIVNHKIMRVGQGLLGFSLCVAGVTIWTRLNFPVFEILPD